ncbi:MAG TPA: ArgE/DapE family deacylase [Chloroflexota bacterium]|nr:ArgE/DapE family deacylase [Chloroflexota bacterium]
MAVLHEVRNIRLLELEPSRAWEPRLPSPPPVEQTQAEIEHRLAEVAPRRQTVFAAIDQARAEIVGCLQQLVRIPSVNTGNHPNPDDRFEKDLAEYVARELNDLGMQVQSIEPAPRRTSVLGRLPGNTGDRSLMIYAHLDTVPTGDPAEWTYPPFSATIADDKIWGRGAKDCKLGLAAALMAARLLERCGIQLNGDLQIVAPADEEMGGQWGIARMIDQGMLKADWAIYGEGTPDQITIGHRGMLNVQVTTRGKTAHTARKHLGENAILKMCQLAPRLDALEFTGWQPHPVVPGGPVASANIIRGGMKENVVADRCTVTYDVRFPPGVHYQTLLDQIQAEIGRAQREIPTLGQVDVELSNVGRPSFMDPDNPLVHYLRRAASEVEGADVPARGMLATSDSRWILLDAGIPIVNFSMGNDSGHRPNEWAGIQDLIDNTKIYALAALLLVG